VITQFSIYKREIFNEKQRADEMTSSFESLRKIFENTLEIVFREEYAVEDFQDCIEHFRSICNLGSQRDIQLLEGYKENYDKLRKTGQKEKETKDKE
jgi:hypothetical protein